MAVATATLLRDVLYTIKNDLSSNITDPISSKRSSKSSFIMTSYPQRPVQYPIVTIRASNVEALRTGMQATTLDVTITLEIRVWARNQKEKDTIYTDVLDRLRSIQFTTGGTAENNLHDFNAISGVEVDEDGTNTPKSRIMEVQYRFFN